MRGVITFKRGRRVLGGAARTADLLWNMSAWSLSVVPVRGSVVLCTAGLEDMAVALSPGKCGSYRQILSNNSVFPLASMPSQSNTRDRPYSPFKRFNIMQHQFDTGYANNNMQNKQVW